MKILILWENIWNKRINWNQKMKLSKINRNTVLHCLKANKFIETWKKIGVNEMVKNSRLIP